MVQYQAEVASLSPLRLLIFLVKQRASCVDDKSNKYESLYTSARNTVVIDKS